MSPENSHPRRVAAAAGETAIVSSEAAAPVSFESLIEDLSAARVVYVGEQHTNPAHHRIQLEIIRGLHEKTGRISVGMEMFDRTYAGILDAWTQGRLDRKTFVRKTHWYANWKFDFSLYEKILTFIKDHTIPLVGLNIPFHIPPKIATGGIENLPETDKRHLPADMDTANDAHRAYVKKIFGMHRVPGRDNFDYFYAAQCVWEETMAAAITENLGAGEPMVVLAGNGHIVEKFGIPDRAYRRTGAPFKTVYPISSGEKVKMTCGDYIWAV